MSEQSELLKDLKDKRDAACSKMVKLELKVEDYYWKATTKFTESCNKYEIERLIANTDSGIYTDLKNYYEDLKLARTEYEDSHLAVLKQEEKDAFAEWTFKLAMKNHHPQEWGMLFRERSPERDTLVLAAAEVINYEEKLKRDRGV